VPLSFVVLTPRVVLLVDCRGEGAVGGLEPARVIGVTHALRVEVYACLALGSSGKQRDVLHVVPQLAEAGIPFVDLPCILQGLRRLQFLGRRGSTVVRFSFFAWRSALWGRWFCDAESYLGGQGHTHGRAKCDAFAVVFEVEGELSNAIGSQGVRAM